MVLAGEALKFYDARDISGTGGLETLKISPENQLIARAYLHRGFEKKDVAGLSDASGLAIFQSLRGRLADTRKKYGEGLDMVLSGEGELIVTQDKAEYQAMYKEAAEILSAMSWFGEVKSDRFQNFDLGTDPISELPAGTVKDLLSRLGKYDGDKSTGIIGTFVSVIDQTEVNRSETSGFSYAAVREGFEAEKYSRENKEGIKGLTQNVKEIESVVTAKKVEEVKTGIETLISKKRKEQQQDRQALAVDADELKYAQEIHVLLEEIGIENIRSGRSKTPEYYTFLEGLESVDKEHYLYATDRFERQMAEFYQAPEMQSQALGRICQGSVIPFIGPEQFEKVVAEFVKTGHRKATDQWYHSLDGRRLSVPIVTLLQDFFTEQLFSPASNNIVVKNTANAREKANAGFVEFLQKTAGFSGEIGQNLLPFKVEFLDAMEGMILRAQTATALAETVVMEDPANLQTKVREHVSSMNQNELGQIRAKFKLDLTVARDYTLANLLGSQSGYMEGTPIFNERSEAVKPLTEKLNISTKEAIDLIGQFENAVDSIVKDWKDTPYEYKRSLELVVNSFRGWLRWRTPSRELKPISDLHDFREAVRDGLGKYDLRIPDDKVQVSMTEIFRKPQFAELFKSHREFFNTFTQFMEAARTTIMQQDIDGFAKAMDNLNPQDLSAIEGFVKVMHSKYEYGMLLEGLKETGKGEFVASADHMALDGGRPMHMAKAYAEKLDIPIEQALRELRLINIPPMERKAVTIITGPNASGKTTAIQTLAFAIGCKEGSKPLYDKLTSPEGPQSYLLLNSAVMSEGRSTFQSHLEKILSYLKMQSKSGDIRNATVFFMDEPEGGTDRRNGLSLSFSLASILSELGVQTAIITHDPDGLALTKEIFNPELKFNYVGWNPKTRSAMTSFDHTQGAIIRSAGVELEKVLMRGYPQIPMIAEAVRKAIKEGTIDRLDLNKIVDMPQRGNEVIPFVDARTLQYLFENMGRTMKETLAEELSLGRAASGYDRNYWLNQMNISEGMLVSGLTHLLQNPLQSQKLFEKLNIFEGKLSQQWKFLLSGLGVANNEALKYCSVINDTKNFMEMFFNSFALGRSKLDHFKDGTSSRKPHISDFFIFNDSPAIADERLDTSRYATEHDFSAVFGDFGGDVYAKTRKLGQNMKARFDGYLQEGLAGLNEQEKNSMYNILLSEILLNDLYLYRQEDAFKDENYYKIAGQYEDVKQKIFRPTFESSELTAYLRFINGEKDQMDPERAKIIGEELNWVGKFFSGLTSEQFERYLKSSWGGKEIFRMIRENKGRDAILKSLFDTFRSYNVRSASDKDIYYSTAFFDALFWVKKSEFESIALQEFNKANLSEVREGVDKLNTVYSAISYAAFIRKFRREENVPFTRTKAKKGAKTSLTGMVNPRMYHLKRDGVIDDIVPQEYREAGDSNLQVLEGANGAGKTELIYNYLTNLITGRLTGGMFVKDGIVDSDLAAIRLATMGATVGIQSTYTNALLNIDRIIREIVSTPPGTKIVAAADEPFTGTSPIDQDASITALLYLLDRLKVNTLITSHNPRVHAKEDGLINKVDPKAERIGFEHREFKPRYGEEITSGGVTTAKLMGWPDALTILWGGVYDTLSTTPLELIVN